MGLRRELTSPSFSLLQVASSGSASSLEDIFAKLDKVTADSVSKVSIECDSCKL